MIVGITNRYKQRRHRTISIESARTDSDSAMNSPFVRLAVMLFISKEHEITGPCLVTIAAFAQPATRAQKADINAILDSMLDVGPGRRLIIIDVPSRVTSQR